jgi:hypothetical protein
MLPQILGPSLSGVPFPTYSNLPTPTSCVEHRRISSHPKGAQVFSFAVYEKSAEFELFHDLIDEPGSEIWGVVSLDGRTPLVVRFGEKSLHFGFADLAPGPHALYASVFIRRSSGSASGIPEIICFRVAP